MTDDERSREYTLADGTDFEVVQHDEADGYPFDISMTTEQANLVAGATGQDVGKMIRGLGWVAAEPVQNHGNYDAEANVQEVTRRPREDREDVLSLEVEYYNPLVGLIVERFHINFRIQDDGRLRYNGFLTEMGTREFTGRIHEVLHTGFEFLREREGWELVTPFDREMLAEYVED